MYAKLLIIFLAIFVTPSIQQGFNCPQEIAIIPHPIPGLCNLFIVCVFGEGQARECPSGQIFVSYNETFGECKDGKEKTSTLFQY